MGLCLALKCCTFGSVIAADKKQREKKKTIEITATTRFLQSSNTKTNFRPSAIIILMTCIPGKGGEKKGKTTEELAGDHKRRLEVVGDVTG